MLAKPREGLAAELWPSRATRLLQANLHEKVFQTGTLVACPYVRESKRNYCGQSHISMLLLLLFQ